MKTVNLKKVSLLMAFIMVLSVASMAQARGFGDGPRGSNWQSNYTALSAEQQAKAQKMFAEHHQKMTPVHQAIITKQAALQAEMIAASPNKATIEKLSKELGELHGKRMAERVELSKALEKEGLPMGHGYGRGQGWHRGGHGTPCYGSNGPGMMGRGYGMGGYGMNQGYGNPVNNR